MISDTELLAYIRPSDVEEIDSLRRLERAAVAAVQKRTGRYFGPVATITETIHFRDWPLQLANEPIEITSVESWDGSAYSAFTDYYRDGSLLRREGSSSSSRYRVTYTAGYEDAGGDDWDAPEDVKQAVILLVGNWYENREAAVVGHSHSGELPFAVSALLDGHTRAVV